MLVYLINLYCRVVYWLCSCWFQ